MEAKVMKQLPDIEFEWDMEDFMWPCLRGMENAEKLKRWGDSIARAAEKERDRQWIEEIEKHQMPDKPESEPYPGLVVMSKIEWQALKKTLEVTKNE